MRFGERSHWRLLAAALLLASGLTGSANAERNALTLLYYERPPFYYTGPDHKPVGILVDATERTLREAGLSFTWEERPPKRILTEVFDGRANTCSPGWFTTAERREKAIYSEMTMIAAPLVGVVNDQSRRKASPDARATVSAMNMILVRDYMTRGSYLDRLLSDLPPGHVMRRTSFDVPSMLATLTAHHADMALMTEEEADWFVPRGASNLWVQHFADDHPREGRYLICGFRFDPATHSKSYPATIPIIIRPAFRPLSGHLF
jgi:polar amino acid transport system substrate-binding protein